MAAWLLARSDEEIEEHLGLIADHLERAGQMEQAVTYLTRAGEQAAAQFANAEAAAYFSRAIDLTPEDEQARRYALLLACERVYDLQGAREAQAQDLVALQELAEAQAHVEEILSYLETNMLDGTDEPFWIYLTCYHFLRANQDPRAQDILDTAHRLLQEQAAKISDEEMRRSFLENVVAHREIVSEWAKGEQRGVYSL